MCFYKEKAIKTLLNDEEYYDFTISENQALINRIKNDYLEVNTKNPLNDKKKLSIIVYIST